VERNQGEKAKKRKVDEKATKSRKREHEERKNKPRGKKLASNEARSSFSSSVL